MVQALNLVCVDGWWMNANALNYNNNNKRQMMTNDLAIDLSSLGDIEMSSDYLNLCGPVVVTAQQLAVTGTCTLNIAGPVYIEDGGVLRVTTDTSGDNLYSRVTISEPCGGWVDSGYMIDLGMAGLHVSQNGTLHVTQDSPVIVNGGDLGNGNQTSLIPLVDVYGCVHMLGNFFYEADSIPQENNYFPFSNSSNWVDCLFEVDVADVETTLPSCPIVYLEIQGSFVTVSTATHRMCAGSIAGLVVGTSAAVAAAGAAGAALLLGSGAPATADYVTL